MTDYTTLRIMAATFEDVQKVRIRIENRHRAYKGSQLGGPDLVLEDLRSLEKSAQKELRKVYIATVSPEVRAWQVATRGIGEHLLARLLGVIGDPLVAIPLDHEGNPRPTEGNPTGKPYKRTIASLRAYCGHGEALRRHKGMTQEDAFALGNWRAKMLVHLLAESVIKQGEPTYRAVYDSAKADKLNLFPEPWTAGHAHAHALRLVGKRILLDLWTAASGEVKPKPTKRVMKRAAKAA